MIRLLVGGSGKTALRSHIEHHEGQPISDARLDAEWTDLTKEGGPTIRPDPADHIRTIMDLLPGTSDMLQASPWFIMRSRNQPLVTGDHPVVLIRDSKSEQWRGVGLTTAAGFGVTLSRTDALVIASLKAGSGDADHMLDLDKNAALEFNCSVVSNARRAIYHHPSDRPADWFGGLPRERSREMAPVGDGWINEEGVGEWLSTGIPVGDDNLDRDQAIGLSEVQWPIAGRTFNWTE